MVGSKRCRVILAFGAYSVGNYIWPSGVLRDDLVGRGFIVVDEEKPQPVAEASTQVNGDEAAVEELTETKELPKRRRRKGGGDG